MMQAKEGRAPERRQKEQQHAAAACSSSLNMQRRRNEGRHAATMAVDGKKASERKKARKGPEQGLKLTRLIERCLMNVEVIRASDQTMPEG